MQSRYSAHRPDVCISLPSSAGFNELESDEIRQCSSKLASAYPSDLQADELAIEMVHFIEFAKIRGAILPVPSPLMYMKDFHSRPTFPNVFNAHRSVSLMV